MQEYLTNIYFLFEMNDQSSHCAYINLIINATTIRNTEI